jgi:hypothetical protein
VGPNEEILHTALEKMVELLKDRYER